MLAVCCEMIGPNKHTHTGLQCSHTSVGLAEARPNYGGISLYVMSNLFHTTLVGIP